MKLNRIIIALASFLACACSVSSIEESASYGLVVREFTASLDPDTKTSLESGGKVLWNASGETITLVDEQGICYNFTQKSVSSDRLTATFSGAAPESGLKYAVYPASSNLNYDDGAVSLTLPSEQQAVADGFPTANIAVSLVTDGSNSLSFKNVCSMIGFKVNASGVSSISFHAREAAGGALAGPALVDFEDGLPYSASDISSGSGHILLNGPIESGKQYFALAFPGTYSDLSVTFTHNDGRSATFTKDVEFTLRRSKIARISTFTINDSDWTGGTESPGEFKLVTSTSSLQAGDEVLIVYNSGSKALGAISSNGNYRTDTNVTISGDTISDPADATVLTLEAGYNGSTWSFKDGNYYLSSASSGNNLQNSTSKNANSSWSISIDSSGNADIKAQAGASSYIRYNTGHPRFSCYDSNAKEQAVSIYRRDASSGGGNPAQPSVTTLAADNIGMADATLHASFKNLPTSPQSVGAFFRWGTSAGNLDQTVYDNNVSFDSASGTFTAPLTGLAEATTYYYQAVVTLHDGSDLAGSVLSFKTKSSQQTSGRGYLDCYEVPTVSTSGSMVSGNESSGKGYKWYRFYTSNSAQRVATHTLNDSSTGNKQIRSYTVLLDKNRQAPLWTAFLMHKDVFPNSVTGRGSWGSDPAFPSDWQQSGVSGYSKGHLVASNYRHISTNGRNQTFYYSNQAPQIQDYFNGGIWEAMEQRIVSVAPTGRDTLYVTVGVLYEGKIVNGKFQAGEPDYVSGVPIPSHFYTCLMKCSFDTSGSITLARGCSYIFENRAYKNSSGKADTNYNNHKETIDNIEQRAGFDFFPNVPDQFVDSDGNIVYPENETYSIL